MFFLAKGWRLSDTADSGLDADTPSASLESKCSVVLSPHLHIVVDRSPDKSISCFHRL